MSQILSLQEAVVFIKTHVRSARPKYKRQIELEADRGIGNNIRCLDAYRMIYGSVSDAEFVFVVDFDRKANLRFGSEAQRDQALRLTLDLIEGKTVTGWTGETVTVGDSLVGGGGGADPKGKDKKKDEGAGGSLTTYIVVGVAAAIVIALLVS